MDKEFWNQRYAEESYAYGETPNVYFASQLMQLNPGTVLLPAEGEGRNAVFAAKNGWNTTCFDISEEGKKKASTLAHLNNVNLTYDICGIETASYDKNSFDLIALIFSHIPSTNRSLQFQQMEQWLKTGGNIILEVFSKNHIEYVTLNPKVGGPKEKALLFSIEEIKEYFPSVLWEKLDEEEVLLDEGKYHQGKGMVIRALGKKIEI